MERLRENRNLILKISANEIAPKTTSAAVPVTTSGYKIAGQASIAKAARGAAGGAIIGGVVDGSDGAGKGAAIGATLGALRRGQTVTITPGSLLEFTLSQPVKISIRS